MTQQGHRAELKVISDNPRCSIMVSRYIYT